MIIRINYTIGIGICKGTKRFHFYRNEYGVEAGCNIVPKRFGIFAYISHPKKETKQ